MAADHIGSAGRLARRPRSTSTTATRAKETMASAAYLLCNLRVEQGRLAVEPAAFRLLAFRSFVFWRETINKAAWRNT